jgi:PAS domain S-box-containing protein
MADTAPVLLWISGTSGDCTWFNKPWLDFVGRALEQEIGNGWAENVHPDDFDFCLRTYREAFAARRAFEMDYRLRRHDGQYRWVLDQAVPRFTPGGEFLGYIGSCVDITERKRAEEAQQALASASALLASSLDLKPRCTMWRDWLCPTSRNSAFSTCWMTPTHCSSPPWPMSMQTRTALARIAPA